jgi:hypothetical protein
MRNPRWRERIRQMHEDVSKGIMDLALATKERWEGEEEKARQAGYLSGKQISYEEMKAFHESGEYTIEVDNHRNLQLEFSGFEAVLPHLFNRGWMFLKAPASSGGFVTCDHPVNLMWSDTEDRGRELIARHFTTNEAPH